MIFAEIQEADGEKLLVIRVVAPKDPNQEIPDEVPKSNIYIDESWNTRDYITPALTDITNRTFTEDQISLLSPCENTPEHLTVEKTKKIEAAHAATSPSESLVLVTAEPDEKDEYLTVLNTRTGREFKVNNQIELTDALSDNVSPLRAKTITNLEINIVVEPAQGIVKLLDANSCLEKSTDSKIKLLDMGSENESFIRLVPSPEVVRVSLAFVYEDLVLARKVSGGVNVTLS